VFITSIWIKQRNQYAFCVSKKNTLWNFLLYIHKKICWYVE
jgi:hypothetical protein